MFWCQASRKGNLLLYCFLRWHVLIPTAVRSSKSRANQLAKTLLSSSSTYRTSHTSDVSSQCSRKQKSTAYLRMQSKKIPGASFHLLGLSRGRSRQHKFVPQARPDGIKGRASSALYTTARTTPQARVHFGQRL